MKKVCVCILSLVVLFGACRSDIPDDVIPPEKMQLILWDLLRADEWIMERRITDTSVKQDPAMEKLYQQVFLIHGTNRETFNQSFRFYQGRPDLSKTIFDSIIIIGNRDRDMRAKADSIRMQQDSVRMKLDSVGMEKDSALLKIKSKRPIPVLRDSLLPGKEDIIMDK